MILSKWISAFGYIFPPKKEEEHTDKLAATSEIWIMVPFAGLTNTGLLSFTSMTVMIRSAVPHSGGRPWSVATTVRLKRSEDWSRRRERTSPVFGSRENASEKTKNDQGLSIDIKAEQNSFIHSFWLQATFFSLTKYVINKNYNFLDIFKKYQRFYWYSFTQTNSFSRFT